MKTCYIRVANNLEEVINIENIRTGAKPVRLLLQEQNNKEINI